MKNPLFELLSQGLVIFDGAIGTEIYRRNFFVNASYEQLNLTRRDVILDIHRQYIDAGAEVIDVMGEIGNEMPKKYKETAEGGLATCPTAMEITKNLPH